MKPRILLVTNDYPPTLGGIQSYLRDFVATLDPKDVVVFASTQDPQAAVAYDKSVAHTVIRWPRKVMLPTPDTIKEMQRLIRAYDIDTVWFGAAAPLAVMGYWAKKAGARHVVATTHGHEVGWSMLPGARQLLAVIGRHADTMTYISDYTLRRFRKAFGPRPHWVHLPSGVDVELFQPAEAQSRADTRRRWGLGDAPVIVCISRLVPRKGQDQLIKVHERVRKEVPNAQLVIVGQGSYRSTLDVMAQGVPGVRLTGALEFDDMRSLLAAADVCAMPARTRGKGLDVEGLGIVYLEAQASGIPVVAGNSGGAPETVTPETGIVVDGRNESELIHALVKLLTDPELRAAMGSAGRRHVLDNWTWDVMGARLRELMGYPAGETH